MVSSSEMEGLTRKFLFCLSIRWNFRAIRQFWGSIWDTDDHFCDYMKSVSIISVIVGIRIPLWCIDTLVGSCCITCDLGASMLSYEGDGVNHFEPSLYQTRNVLCCTI